MNNSINIKRATTEDINTLVQVARKSFYDTFSQFSENSPEDLQSYLDKFYTVEALSEEFAETDNTYFVAEIDGQLVGYAKLKQHSREQGVNGNNPIELCRLYNLQEYIGKGVGKALMQKCLDFAEKNWHDTIWLGVWENNNHAINFYRKFSFEKCGQHIFQLGTDSQTDWLMQRSVDSFHESEAVN